MEYVQWSVYRRETDENGDETIVQGELLRGDNAEAEAIELAELEQAAESNPGVTWYAAPAGYVWESSPGDETRSCTLHPHRCHPPAAAR